MDGTHQISINDDYILGSIEDLVSQGGHYVATVLIVCWSRKDTFDQLIQQIAQRNDASYAVPSSQQSEETTAEDNLSARHPFLTPSLQLLASSKFVKLAFCPTVPNLRAYLSSFPTNTVSDSLPQPVSERLFIFDLLALHHGTSEFTLQGLSRTFASAISAAHRSQSSLTLVECKDINDPSNPDRGFDMWNAQVPLLSGSVKIGQEGATWAGRSISIRSIAARWFTFEARSLPEPAPGTGFLKQEEEDDMLL